jgi:hypothetical protein
MTKLDGVLLRQVSYFLIVMLSVIMLNVVIPSVMAPRYMFIFHQLLLESKRDNASNVRFYKTFHGGN